MSENIKNENEANLTLSLIPDIDNDPDLDPGPGPLCHNHLQPVTKNFECRDACNSCRFMSLAAAAARQPCDAVHRQSRGGNQQSWQRWQRCQLKWITMQTDCGIRLSGTRLQYDRIAQSGRPHQSTGG